MSEKIQPLALNRRQFLRRFAGIAAVPPAYLMGLREHSPEAETKPMTPFYVCDSASIEVSPPKTIHPAGVFNCSKMWEPGEAVVVHFMKGSFYVGVTDKVEGQSVNADVQIGLYRIIDDKVQLAGILPFMYPYGGAENGLVMNGTTGGRDFQTPCPMEFYPDDPIVLGGWTPRDPGKYQVGAVLTIFCNHPFKSVNYVYTMSGRVTPI